MKLTDLFEVQHAHDLSGSAQVSIKELVHELSPTFLSRTGKAGLLYRGMRLQHSDGANKGILTAETEDGPAEYYILKSRADRKTANTDPALSRIVDKWFLEKFGHPFRSNVVFCTGEYHDAVGYGNATSAIFPIGKWSYVWSPIVNDLFVDLQENIDYVSPDELNAPSKFKEGKIRATHVGRIIKPETFNSSDVFHWMDSKKYTNNNIDKAIQFGHEIMVDCDEYVAIPVSTSRNKKFIRRDEIERELGLR